MSNFISRGIKGVRRALHLPPITLKNVATKYGPAALTVASLGGAGPLAGIAGKLGSVASSIPGAAKAGAILSGAKRVLGGAGAGVPQVMRNGQPITLSDINPNIPSSGGGAPGGGGGGTDWLGLAEGGLAGLSAVNAAKQSGRAGKYQDAALAQANARWQEGAPLRAAAVPRLLNPARPDLTQVYNDPTNAFSRPVPPVRTPAPRPRFGT